MEQESKTALEWFEEANQKGHEWAQLAINNISMDSLKKYPSISKALALSFAWDKTPEGLEFWGKLHDVVWTVEREHPFK
jgi:TPR repeat protein